MFKVWNFWKHLIFSSVISLAVRFIGNRISTTSSIGIIGGADGPTAVFTTGNIYPDIISIAILIILLALYKPIRNMFEMWGSDGL